MTASLPQAGVDYFALALNNARVQFPVAPSPVTEFAFEHEAEMLRIADWAADMASPDERHILYRALLNVYRLGRNHEALEALARAAK